MPPMTMGAVNSAGTDWPVLAVAVETVRSSLKWTGVPAGTTTVRVAAPADTAASRRTSDAAKDFVVIAASATASFVQASAIGNAHAVDPGPESHATAPGPQRGRGRRPSRHGGDQV